MNWYQKLVSKTTTNHCDSITNNQLLQSHA